MASWLSPEQALALIPGMSGDYRLQPLAGGHSNPVWRVDSAAGPRLLRLHPRQQQRAINREAEHWAWQQAAAAGLAPRLYHWDPHHRFSLSHYLQGAALANHGVNPAQVAPLAALLAQLHRLDGHRLPRHDYAALALSALTMLPHPDPQLQRLGQQASHWQQQLWQLGPAACLCHHDPSPANILDDGQQLWLLDFEYAALGSPLFDLAAISADWPEPERQALLQAYCQHAELAAFNPLAVTAAQALYLLLSLLWWLGQPAHSQTSQRLRQQLVELLACQPQLRPPQARQP